MYIHAELLIRDLGDGCIVIDAKVLLEPMFVCVSFLNDQ